MSNEAKLTRKQRCLAVTRQGEPCRSWAMHDSQERYGRPLCRVHAPSAVAGAEDEGQWHLYTDYFTAEERTALEQAVDKLAGEQSLSGEIEAARIMLRRLFAHMAALGVMTTEEIVRLTPLVLFTARTVARLLKDQQVLEQGEPDEHLMILGQALDRISEEWGIEL